MNLTKLPPKLPVVLFIVFIVLTLSSCVPQRKMMFLMDDTGSLPSELQSFENLYRKEYRLQPNDLLFIRVLGLDQQTTDLFSIQPTGMQTQLYHDEMSVYLNSFKVDADGSIEFPVIGKINVKERTLDEVSDLVQNAVNEFIRDATVIVRLVNFRISVLGEVARPGRYIVAQNEITIFESIALAGDMTPWGNRRNVQVVRKTKDGYDVFGVDLSQRNILESEVFYLMPDDIVYVVPMDSKTYAFTAFPYHIVLSTITTTLLILNFFR